MGGKDYLILVLMATVSAVVTAGAGAGLVIVALGGVGYFAYSMWPELKDRLDSNRYKHLNGSYTIELASVKRFADLVVDVTYRGEYDGSFDIEKIYRKSNSSLDIWEVLSSMEKSEVQYEIRSYFWRLRGHGPVAR